MTQIKECIICGSDNKKNEEFVKSVSIDGMVWEYVCGYCEEGSLHEDEDRSKWVGWEQK